MKKRKKLLSGDTENNTNETKLDTPELDVADNNGEDPQEQFLNPPPKKKENKEAKKAENDPDWNEEITLTPEEYEELDNGELIKEDVPEEETKQDLNLGEAGERDHEQFQLTMHFDGSEESATSEEVEQERKYDPEKPRFMDWVFDIAEMFVFVLAAVMILTSFVFKHSVVEGGSMLNTLEDGDHLIISDLFYTPDYGDIVVFEDYSKDASYRKAVIKRVIALPGDTVEIKVAEDGKALKVYVNGEPIKDEHAYYLPTGTPTAYGPVTVGEGQIFVLGDNRYNSTDSREVGTINIDSILGKVILRFSPFDKFGFVE